jgi:glycosyltransferase involved in cell wall biosynthesis
MRVLLVGRLPHGEIGGVPIYTHGLGDALARAGAAVDVLFPGPASGRPSSYRELPCDAVASLPGWLGQRAQRFAEGFALARAAAQAVEQNGYDIVNVQYGGAMDLVVVRRLLATAANVAVTAHCGPSWWHLRRAPAVACRVLARARAVLTLSQDQRRLFAQNGVPEARLADAPALIEAAFFEPVPAGRRGDDGMYLGRIAPGKGIEALIEALAQCRQPPTIRLVGPSTGAYRMQLMRLASSLGVSAAIRWYPAVRSAAERVALLSECRFLVHPTQQDVRPLAVIEAMASGVPIVASALPGTLELLAGHGRTFAPGDRDALARCLEDEAGLPAPAGSLERGRQLASCYHPDVAAARFLQLCNSMGRNQPLAAAAG